MKRMIVAALAGFTMFAFADAGSVAPPASELQAIVAEQFGSQFVLMQKFPLLTGDFNGDGAEDALFVATSKGGFQGTSERYRVFDPSSEYFGIGDPKITARFASPYADGPRYLLIIHGNGKEGWHAKEPKARFLLINVSFDKLSVGHIERNKKVFDHIGVEETGILN